MTALRECDGVQCGFTKGLRIIVLHITFEGFESRKPGMVVAEGNSASRSRR